MFHNLNSIPPQLRSNYYEVSERAAKVWRFLTRGSEFKYIREREQKMFLFSELFWDFENPWNGYYYCYLWLVTSAQPSTTSSPFFSSTKTWSDVFYSLVIFPFGATNCQFPHSQGISLFPLPSFRPSLSGDLAGLALCTIQVRQAVCATASPFILSLLARELWREMVWGRCVGVCVYVCLCVCVRERECAPVCVREWERNSAC